MYMTQYHTQSQQTLHGIIIIQYIITFDLMTLTINDIEHMACIYIPGTL